MNSQVSAGSTAGQRSLPERWPVRSGTVPPLAECFNLRPETGFDFAISPGPGQTAVLAAPAPPQPAGGFPRAGTIPQAGMGGTGKTQLASALARFLWGAGAVDLLAWVPAASRDSLITGYAQASAAAGLPGAGEAPEAAAASFVDWLADTGRPWLVVLDDLADVADLDELWPRGAAGRTVVTTRLPAAAVRGPGRNILEIGAFSTREALSYLTSSLYPDQRTGAIDLARDLGCLPLGLAQAIAVIADTEIDCDRYRARLADRRRQMSVPRADPYAGIVAATWSISLDRADSTAPAGLARPALALVALLESGGIPAAVLTSRAACDFICGRHAMGTPADESQVAEVLDRMRRVGLVTLDPESAARTVAMHSLVQATARQVIPPAMLEQTVAAAAGALMQAWPHGDREPLVAQALRDCTASLHQAAADLLWTPEAHPVLLRAGQSLDRCRLPSLAISFWRGMVGTGTRILGPSHASTLLARDHLAAACEAAGRPQDAVAALENSLAERDRTLGSDHPETLSARSSLAHAHLAAGRLDDAIVLNESTLADRGRLLGPGHPDTITSRGNLAAAYRAAGRMQDAISVLQRTLRDLEATAGPDDPETLAACADLAAAWHQCGRVQDAILLYERALADRERVLGPDHPDTVTSLANLASACHSARMLKTAIPLYEQAVSARDRMQGPDHPDTLAARANLASAYHTMGRLTEAVAVFEATLADCERYLPPGHPMTQTIRENLRAAR